MKLYCLLLSLLLLSACAAAPTPAVSPTSPATATPTVTDTPSPDITLTDVPVRATDDRPTAPSIRDVTFPPTFTATPTYTATPSPTLTYTPSPTPTLTTSDICDLFIAGTNKEPGSTYRSGEIIIFRLDTQGVTDVTMQTVFRYEGNDTEFDLNLSGGERTIVTINPVDFGESGDYTWESTLSIDDESGLCPRTGSFVLELSEATEEATPEVTAERTEAVRIITATPLIVIVTATPDTTAEATANRTPEVTAAATATPGAD